MAFWVGFNAFVVLALVFDLFVLHRKAHAVTVKEATIQSAGWIALSVAFNVLVYLWKGPQAGMEFLTCYLVEYSLSIDNIFVFIMIFSYFKVHPMYQHRVLFWGILGAIVMRGIFIVAGSALLEQFEWLIYIFGGFLVFTGVRMGTQKEMEVDPDANPVLKVVRKVMPVTDQYEGQRFFAKRAGRLFVTPLFLVLLLVESTDLVFAMDSIPAVLSISKDSFIVYTSNIFAILGLRSLYFMLSGAAGRFRFLKYGLAVVLTFVGIKMMIAHFVHIPIIVSLLVVFGVLLVSMAASVAIPEKVAPPHGK